MIFIFYWLVIGALLSSVPYDEYLPQSTQSFKLLMSALKNETLEFLGSNFQAFDRILERERLKWAEQNKRK